MIIRGGYNVYPREIEEVLYEHPAVREAAVIGDPARRARRGGRRRRRAQGRRATATRRRAARRSSRSGSPPTSTRATSGSSTSCPRARPARSSSARSSHRSPSPKQVDPGSGRPVACGQTASVPQAGMTRSSSSTYWPRWRGPRNRSRTRVWAASPMRSARVRVGEQALDALAEGGEVASGRPGSRCGRPRSGPGCRRRGGDDRAALPHRLGDGEPEALGQALLRDDVGAPLQRVDDHGVLVGVLHRQQREVHAAADAAAAARARPPRPRRRPRRPRGRRPPPSRRGPRARGAARRRRGRARRTPPARRAGP